MFWRCTISFSSGALPNLSMMILKMMKDCKFVYVSSGGLVTRRRKAVLWGTACCYLQLKENAGPKFRVDFAKGTYLRT